ncbi:DMT family transporter [Malikia sp.]|uniref:DMT family transporter n=1 Tax=Malikia sp. TaxID=2070706 RepID=UPI002638A936|nr:DMT family transporter [Malikia sp.]MDD2730329.1 DMT family transporter [Malikia sp.]
MNANSQRLDAKTVLLLTLAPLLWASNTIVGRLAAGWIPPMTFNLLRWSIALLVLLPLGGWVLRRSSPLWREWKYFTLLGLLAIAGYNSLQYLALHTSSALNVTLVAASMPVWMLLVGRIGFGAAVTAKALLGAALSLAGVGLVLTQGELARLLQLQFVPGDGWILLAAFSWACYSWLLTRRQGGAAEIRQDWAAFLLAQIAFGLVWSLMLTTGEWLLPAQPPQIIWSWQLAAVLLFVALGPALIAYRCWGAGVGRAGPTLASFFSNLTPLFAALMSAALLGEPPRPYHVIAFALIVGGILVSARR